MKHIFIVNPAAGKVNQTPKIRTLAEQLCPDGAYQVITSQGFGDCQRIAREAGESGEECLIYACGGDGTLNEVVNGAMGFSNLWVTSCPCGSGNDFVKQFPNPKAFFEPEQYRDIRREQIDVMQINDRYAVNVCSVGFDARIGTDINAFRRHPLLSGPRAYHASVVVNLLRGVAKACRVELPGEEPIDGEQTLVCVCNGSWYGGSYHPVPEASVQDGLLDVLVVKKVSRLTVAQVISTYQKGNYASRPDLIRHYRVSSLHIETPEPEPVNLDGELLRTTDVDIRVIPGGLNFFAPKAAWEGEKTFL
jgi:YegS/Rv2252/BmrU family lipid kinase